MKARKMFMLLRLPLFLKCLQQEISPVPGNGGKHFNGAGRYGMYVYIYNIDIVMHRHCTLFIFCDHRYCGMFVFSRFFR